MPPFNDVYLPNIRSLKSLRDDTIIGPSIWFQLERLIEIVY